MGEVGHLENMETRSELNMKKKLKKKREIVIHALPVSTWTHIVEQFFLEKNTKCDLFFSAAAAPESKEKKLPRKKNPILETSAPTTSTPSAASTPHPATSATTSATAAIRLLARLVLRLWLVVYKQRVERQAVGQDIMTDCRATNVDRVERDWVSSLRSHFHSTQSGVHLRRNRRNSAVQNGAFAPSVQGLDVMHYIYIALKRHSARALSEKKRR